MENKQNTNNEQHNNNNNNNNNNNTNKEGEKKMEKVYSLVDIRTAMALADDAQANTDSKLACEYLDTMDDMNNTFSAYNKQLLADCYNEMQTPADVMKRGHYSPFHSQWDKKNKCFRAVPRIARLNVLDFIEHKGIDSTLPEKVEALAEKLAAFIQSEVQFDGGKKTVPVKAVVPLLQTVIDTIALPGVIARNRDIRFLAYAVTGGSASIGSLRKVEVARVASLLVDVYRVQMNGLQYDFEKKEEGNK